jgi:hypothetical protein
MLTLHERYVKETVDQHCLENPDLAALIFNRLAWIKEGQYTQIHLDIVTQKTCQDYSIYDAYCLVRIEALMMERKFAHREIKVAGNPRPDREDEENNRLLTNMPGSFEARFYGGPRDDDGFLKWGREEAFFRVYEEGKDVVVLRPSVVPLEVGTTKSSRTLFHLMFDRGIARWPYGSSSIHIFKVIEDEDVIGSVEIDG